MPPEDNLSQNLNQDPSQAPPPRYGPQPSQQPIVQPPLNTEPSQLPPSRKGKIWIILLIIAVLVVAAGLTYWFWPKSGSENKSKAQPSQQAVERYSPSLVKMAKDSSKWQNGSFEVQGGHGLPQVKGLFTAVSDNNFYTVANVNAQVVRDGVNSLNQATQKEHPNIYTGNEFQLDTLGLLNQVGYGLDSNVIDFLQELLTFDDPNDLPGLTECLNDLPNYYAKTSKYLNSLQPNYVYNEKYQSYIWQLDTTELFNNVAVVAQSPICYDFLDQHLENEIDIKRLAGTQLLFETTDESENGATLKMFVGPPAPSEEYELVYKMTISSTNKTATPAEFTSDPRSLFSRNSAFALTISQCNGLPVIAKVREGKPIFVSPGDSVNYVGPNIRDLGYYCTADEAAADGYVRYP